MEIKKLIAFFNLFPTSYQVKIFKIKKSIEIETFTHSKAKAAEDQIEISQFMKMRKQFFLGIN